MRELSKFSKRIERTNQSVAGKARFDSLKPAELLSIRMNENIRNLFPGALKRTYLNSAAVSPIPTVTVNAVLSQLKDVSENGTVNYAEWIATKERCRSLVAAMIGARDENVAFLRNTSDGFSAIAAGMKWQKGDNIVSFVGEFPSNFYPWRSVRDQFGVELRLCAERDGRVDEDELISMIDSKTKLVAISAVQFASGFRANLQRIGEAARKADALFAVDFIQGLGAMGFDFPAQLVDVGAGASHKWLFAPEGCGILYVSDRARERIAPRLVGWISVETPWDFDDREQNYKPAALSWESGTGPSSLFYGLEQSLLILRDAGLDNIERYLSELSDLLCEGLEGRGYEMVSSRRPGEKSQIVCIRHLGGMTSTEIFRLLESEGIVISPRGERLRIAPHLFNNRADIERLLAHLP